MYMKIIKNESYIKQILEKYDITYCFSNFTKIRPGVKVIVFPKNTFINYVFEVFSCLYYQEV